MGGNEEELNDGHARPYAVKQDAMHLLFTAMIHIVQMLCRNNNRVLEIENNNRFFDY